MNCGRSGCTGDIDLGLYPPPLLPYPPIASLEQEPQLGGALSTTLCADWCLSNESNILVKIGCPSFWLMHFVQLISISHWLHSPVSVTQCPYLQHAWQYQSNLVLLISVLREWMVGVPVISHSSRSPKFKRSSSLLWPFFVPSVLQMMPELSSPELALCMSCASEIVLPNSLIPNTHGNMGGWLFCPLSFHASYCSL